MIAPYLKCINLMLFTYITLYNSLFIFRHNSINVCFLPLLSQNSVWTILTERKYNTFQLFRANYLLVFDCYNSVLISYHTCALALKCIFYRGDLQKVLCSKSVKATNPTSPIWSSFLFAIIKQS